MTRHQLSERLDCWFRETLEADSPEASAVALVLLTTLAALRDGELHRLSMGMIDHLAVDADACEDEAFDFDPEELFGELGEAVADVPEAPDPEETPRVSDLEFMSLLVGFGHQEVRYEARQLLERSRALRAEGSRLREEVRDCRRWLAERAEALASALETSRPGEGTTGRPAPPG